MTKPTPSANRTLIEVNTANIQNMKEGIVRIEDQVTNHLPTRMRELDTKIICLDEKVDGLAIRLAGLVAVVTFIVQYYLK